MFSKKHNGNMFILPLSPEEIPLFAASLFEVGKNGVVILDAVGKIAAVNTAMCNIIGDARENLIGLLPKFLFAGSASPDAYKAFIHDLVSTGKWNGSVQARNAKGEMVPMEAAFSAISNILGENHHFVGVCTPHPAMTEIADNLNANFDPLTGLLSHYALKPRLEYIIARAEKYMSVATVAYINVDSFSGFDAAQGYACGDELLKGTAQILKRALDKSYTVARLKSDKFLVVIQDVYSQDEIKKIADGVLASLMAPGAVHKGDGSVSYSIGVASYPFSGDTADEIIAAAKTAAEAAKRAGGGRVAYHKLFSEVEQENLAPVEGCRNSDILPE
ncbi:MAG: sensor domain-containing diguanylate cyclase [Rickettsiales bacterium]|jgi:diguanylate cyclase (GGDEF)-like protein/PAS domain S-box-containing protein|nr:sensor domain-containing diguanylate cyclase [Rickettsiales bacterium]